MSTSATVTAVRFKNFNRRTTVKVLIHIKYVKNANHLGIIRNDKRTRKNVFILKIWSTADLKRENFIVYKVKSVLLTYIFLTFLMTKILVTFIFFRKNFSSIMLLLLSKLRLFAKQCSVLVCSFLKNLHTFEWVNIIWLLTFEWINIIRLLPERPFFLSIQCLFFLSILKLFPWNLFKIKMLSY